MASNRPRGSTIGIEMFASQAAWIAMTLLQSSEGGLWPSLARLLAPDCTDACHLVKGSARRTDRPPVGICLRGQADTSMGRAGFV